MVVYACSGVIMSQGSTSAAMAIPEMTAYSGSAYLYFYSDAAVNMSGFSIRYRYVCGAADVNNNNNNNNNNNIIIIIIIIITITNKCISKVP